MGRIADILRRAVMITVALVLVAATTSQYTLHLCGGVRPVSHCGCPEAEDSDDHQPALVDASCCSAELVVVEHSAGEPVRKDTCPMGQVGLTVAAFAPELAPRDVHVPGLAHRDPGRGPPVPLLLQKRVLLI